MFVDFEAKSERKRLRNKQKIVADGLHSAKYYENSVKNKSVQNYSVQYNGYNLIGVTTVERGDGSYDSTGLFNITYANI